MSTTNHVHVTRISNGAVYGHDTSHCDEGGCAGDELYFSEIPATDCQRGEIVDLGVVVAAKNGAEYARQISADPVNHQNGPGGFARGEDLPDSDYTELRRRFGAVTSEMETAYREAYNTAAQEIE